MAKKIGIVLPIKEGNILSKSKKIEAFPKINPKDIFMFVCLAVFMLQRVYVEFIVITENVRGIIIVVVCL